MGFALIAGKKPGEKGFFLKVKRILPKGFG